MPANAKSLQVTERYRGGMVRLRQQGQWEAKRIWNRVSPDNLDATFNVGVLELTVATLQKEAARLSSAYLASFIASELGEPERPPALSVWDKTFGGNPLREGLRSAVITTKQKIKDGADPTEATRGSRDILVSDVGLFIDTAARESLRQGMEQDDRIVGYQRAVKGTCGACSGDTQYEAFSENAPVVPLSVHPNCFPAGTVVSGPKARAATTRWYEGDLIELRTRDNLLTCTPNHPILTPLGWVAAHELHKGGDVICNFGLERGEGGIGPDDYEGPAVIEEVAVALRRSGSVSSASVPISSEDFHGDAIASEDVPVDIGIERKGGNVDVVWTNRLLKRCSEVPPIFDEFREPAFCLRCANLLALAGLCGLAALSEGSLATASSAVGGFGLGFSLLSGHARGLEPLGLTHGSEDAFLFQDAVDGDASDSIPSRERLLTFASEVQADKLLSVRLFPFRGHVYNLQTDDGWYIANGMIVHNCQCVSEPVVIGKGLYRGEGGGNRIAGGNVFGDGGRYYTNVRGYAEHFGEVTEVALRDGAKLKVIDEARYTGLAERSAYGREVVREIGEFNQAAKDAYIAKLKEQGYEGLQIKNVLVGIPKPGQAADEFILWGKKDWKPQTKQALGASAPVRGDVVVVWDEAKVIQPAAPRSTGQEIFDSLSKEKQDEMLGPEAAEKVRKGEATLADFIEKDGGFIRQRPASDV